MTKHKLVRPKLNTYRIISDAVEHGLGFALNRLEDHGVEISEEQRLAATEPMMNELMLAICDVIDFGDD